MKHTIVILLALLGLVSCSGHKTALKDSDRTSLIQMIESHDNTLIYIWADYCEASKSMLETNIKPYLEDLERNNVGIVIIHYGKEEAVVDLKSENRLVINLDLSIPFSLLKDYRKTKAMPIPLLVNKDGFVENYDEEDGHYGYTKIYSLLTIHK